MKKILVIGGGIAGTVLAAELLRRGAAVELADIPLPGRASAIAAGVVNPVTGKRFVKSWRVDEFLPVAKKFYEKTGAGLGIKIWHNLPILKLLNSIKEENDWAARCALPDFEKYIAPRHDAGNWSALLRDGFYFGEIREAGRADFPLFINTFREKCRAAGTFREEKITPVMAEKLLPEFDHVIFCEGFWGKENPFFPNDDWQLAKGEALHINIVSPRAAEISEILKKKIMLVPLGHTGHSPARAVFWAGANYEWDFKNAEPTAAGRDFILEELQEMLAVPFEIIGHFAAVRPTLVSRRPVVGLLPGEPKIGIFNGLGTKGALLAPFFAGQLADEILRK